MIVASLGTKNEKWHNLLYNVYIKFKFVRSNHNDTIGLYF